MISYTVDIKQYNHIKDKQHWLTHLLFQIKGLVRLKLQESNKVCMLNSENIMLQKQTVP